MGRGDVQGSKTICEHLKSSSPQDRWNRNHPRAPVTLQAHGALEIVTRSCGSRRPPSWGGMRVPTAGVGRLPPCRPAPARMRQPGYLSGMGTWAAVADDGVAETVSARPAVRGPSSSWTPLLPVAGMPRIRLCEKGQGVTQSNGLTFQSSGVDELGRLHCDTSRRHFRDPSGGTCGQDGRPLAGVHAGMPGSGA